MKFRLSTNELFVFNRYFKSQTIKMNLTKRSIEPIERECEIAADSLVEKFLLQKKGSDYALADEILPFPKSFENSNFYVSKALHAKDGILVDNAGFCSVKKETIATLSHEGGDCFALGFYDTRDIDVVLSDFLGLGDDAFPNNNVLPSFFITVSMKELEEYIAEYKNNPENAANQHHKAFGLPKDQLKAFGEVTNKADSISTFVVISKKGKHILYTVFKKDNTIIFGTSKLTMFSEKPIFFHQPRKELLLRAIPINQ